MVFNMLMVVFCANSGPTPPRFLQWTAIWWQICWFGVCCLARDCFLWYAVGVVFESVFLGASEVLGFMSLFVVWFSVFNRFQAIHFSVFWAKHARKRILLVENKPNLFICELMVLVCHIHHVTNEASKKRAFGSHEKFCGRRK